jgi:hypothetical protein
MPVSNRAFQFASNGLRASTPEGVEMAQFRGQHREFARRRSVIDGDRIDGRPHEFAS